MILRPITVMRQEHDEAGGELKAPGPRSPTTCCRRLASATPGALSAGLAKFAEDLTDISTKYIQHQNNILFSKFEG
jgi:iron-sulfur cluster repair protein YtfE (RIC family)